MTTPQKPGLERQTTPEKPKFAHMNPDLPDASAPCFDDEEDGAAHGADPGFFAEGDGQAQSSVGKFVQIIDAVSSRYSTIGDDVDADILFKCTGRIRRGR